MCEYICTQVDVELAFLEGCSQVGTCGDNNSSRMGTGIYGYVIVPDRNEHHVIGHSYSCPLLVNPDHDHPLNSLGAPGVCAPSCGSVDERVKHKVSLLKVPAASYKQFTWNDDSFSKVQKICI